MFLGCCFHIFPKSPKSILTHSNRCKKSWRIRIRAPKNSRINILMLFDQNTFCIFSYFVHFCHFVFVVGHTQSVLQERIVVRRLRGTLVWDCQSRCAWPVFTFRGVRARCVPFEFLYIGRISLQFV